MAKSNDKNISTAGAQTTPAAGTQTTTGIEGFAETLTPAASTEPAIHAVDPVFSVKAVGLPRRMRAGRVFTAKPVKIRQSELTEEQWEAIDNDDYLKVKQVSVFDDNDDQDDD
ncbi:hypothetical protein I2492_06050 [Budviciaceae bacterium CWB-B4]|uniref:Mu-like prophage FluMu N-terminal domain-containing protein n=1 Tax=Limnobaculum xujianqingii TaxID=2738837 RepID=A0A9D7FWZ5_9GAMM|nr:hypothetical protein [Limnobaculum xujianqingii]MBK5072571.1 hypothetical protein [Limnobaculum xujianqingii]MBK5175880.1 hypothetical protein [Limnobaculum xujianqingii]